MSSFFARRSFAFYLLASLAGFAVPLSFAHAAGPQTVITWQASRSYVPPSYLGKVLPNLQSQITASVMVFSGNAEINLANQTIYWYLDDTLLGGGVGAQSMDFPPFSEGSNSETLKVEIPDYPGGLLIATVPLPIAQPVVIVNAPFPGGNFSANPVVLTASPYFFDVTSQNALSFSWTVNGQTVSSPVNPNVLQIDLPQGTTAGSSFSVSLAVANALDGTTASGETTIVYQPLP